MTLTREEVPWTPDRIRALGMTTNVETAAQIIGIGRTLAYELVRTDSFPVRLLRLGRCVRVPTCELLAFLGVTVARDSYEEFS